MRRGFSLVELLVVVAIIAALVGVAAPYYADYVRESKISKAKQDLDALKGAVVLYNSREDIPYLGPLATITPYLPVLGENDFSGLQGQYLTNIPPDPWGKNYKLDPYGGFVYSDGPDSRTPDDDIREYYIRDLAVRKIEWEDRDNNRQISADDIIYLRFNKAVARNFGDLSSDFSVWENNQLVSTVSFGLSFDPGLNLGYDTLQAATHSTLICRVLPTNGVQLGVHGVSIKSDVATRELYSEVLFDRGNSSYNVVRTRIERNAASRPLRFIVTTSPIKIVPRN